ncbi:MAG TPA: UvrB/UvrC motif-containing protein [Longimicrobiales bacterium]|nr:UvrB/UvrC motif-containing protein [Longimicrobiales bacterium]
MLPTRPRPASDLRADVRAACHNRPGVYRMLGPGDEVLYVGKSVRVRARLMSYFRADRGDKAADIIGNTHRIDWEYTPSDFAALLLEMRSIQQCRPPFNVEHKRDRVFCFVKLTREEAPRLLVVREVLDDGAIYFGPFRGPQRVREVVREIRDLLELRDCAAGTKMRFADQLDLFGADPQPLCMRADIRKCLAPCAGRCTKAEYRTQVELARRFLDGDADIPLTILRRRMDRAADRLQFEYAAELRDRMHRLEDARAELVSLRGFIESLSFVYEVPGHAGADRVYIIRRGSIREERPAPADEAGRDELTERARRLLQRRESCARVAPTQAAEILLLARWFRLRPHELERTWRVDGQAGPRRLPVL